MRIPRGRYLQTLRPSSHHTKNWSETLHMCSRPGKHPQQSLQNYLRKKLLTRNPKQKPSYGSESIRLTVTCLYKHPLRKPAPIERLNNEPTEEVSCYQQFDILFIKDKFPDKRLDAQITVRLGRMITRRRQLLLHRKSHQENLRTAPSSQPEAAAKNPGEFATWTEPEAANANEPGMRPAFKAQSQPESNRITLKSKASTLHIATLPSMNVDDLFALSVAELDSKTTLAASEATRDICVDVPPRPRNHEGLGMTRFKCKYCFLTPYIRSDRD